MVLVDNELLAQMTTDKGQNILDISSKKPVLAIFLRHFGCQFCREAMNDLSKLHPKFIEQGIELVFVHMAENKVADDYFKKFNLINVQHISDPTCHFYAAFGLVKGTFTQLFGLQSWFRGFTLQSKFGNEMGNHLGDSFQMPGAFMIMDGEIKDSFINKSVADKPDYTKLLHCCNIH